MQDVKSAIATIGGDFPDELSSRWVSASPYLSIGKRVADELIATDKAIARLPGLGVSATPLSTVPRSIDMPDGGQTARVGLPSGAVAAKSYDRTARLVCW
jgi:hypothetical protein